MFKKLIVKIMDKLFNRDEIFSYEGYGNFSSERGWIIFGKFVSSERFLK